MCGIGFQPVVVFDDFDRLEAYPTQKITTRSVSEARRRASVFVAPEGRQEIARGVSPWGVLGYYLPPLRAKWTRREK